MKKNYVILYGDKASRTSFRGAELSLAGKSSERLTAKLKFSIAIEELESTKANDMKNRNQDVIAIAPAIPLSLVRPFQTRQVDVDAAEKDIAWNIQATGSDRSAFDGKGIKIAILDTGIDKCHAAFAGIAITEKDFTGEGNGDKNGHGTHCAGVAFGRDVAGRRIGIARGVDDVLIGKVLGLNGGGSDLLVEAINWAVSSGAHIISMSLGIDFPGYARQLEDDGLHIEAAVSHALEGYRKNVLLFERLASLIRIQAQSKFTQPVMIVGAAGNESSRPAYKIATSPPSVSEGFVSVGALGRTSSGLYVAEFSNTGVVLSAPGVDIISAEASGDLIAMDGTSMAAPHVAGIAALWGEKLSRKNQFNLNSWYSNLTVSCDDQYLSKEDPEDYGAGMIQAPTR